MKFSGNSLSPYIFTIPRLQAYHITIVVIRNEIVRSRICIVFTTLAFYLRTEF